MASIIVLEDCSLETCGHPQLNRGGKIHQAASTSASLGLLKHSHSKEQGDSVYTIWYSIGIQTLVRCSPCEVQILLSGLQFLSPSSVNSK